MPGFVSAAMSKPSLIIWASHRADYAVSGPAWLGLETFPWPRFLTERFVHVRTHLVYQRMLC